MSSYRRILFLLVMLFALFILLNSCGSSDANLPTNPGSEEQSPPIAPNNLLAFAISLSEIRLTWEDQSTNETGFQIFESVNNDSTFSMVEEVDANMETTVLYGKSREDDYYYKIRAINEYGTSNFSNVAEAAGGALILTIDTGDSPVWSIAYDPLGVYVVAGCGDHKVRRYAVEDGDTLQESRLHEHPLVHSVACSPDGQYIASGSQDHTVRVWDTIIERVVYTFTNDRLRNVEQLEYSANGNYLVGLSEHIWVWDPYTGNLIEELGPDNVTSFAFVSDTRDLILATNYGLELWQIEGADSALVKHQTTVGRDLAVSPNRDYVATCHDNAVLIWQISGSGADMTFNFIPPDNIGDDDWHSSVVKAVDFSSDGVYLVSGALDGKIKIWRVDDFSLESTLDAHNPYVYCLDCSAEGNYLVSGGGDTKVKIWAIYF